MAALRFTCIWWCFLLICHEVVSGCTSGFMNLDLLRRRAVKIPEGGRTNTILDDEFRLMLNRNFTCSGTITSLLTGATYRTGGGRNEFPEVQVWRSNPEGTVYTRQGSTQITLAARDFSPDGVHRYDLINPIPFQSGDVLGVYQPEEGDSAVTLFYNIDASAPNTRVLSSRPTTSVNLSSLAISSGQQILITPVSDSPSCTGNFLSTSELRKRVLQTNINAVRRRENQLRLFPQIYFTCNGSVTKLIAGVEVGGGAMPFSEMQIWRRNFVGANIFTCVNSSLLRMSGSAVIMNNVIELSLESPIDFQKGDILGVSHPRRGDTNLIFAYQERDGPENYRVNSPSSSTLNIDGTLSNQYDYPLVTVEISTASTSVLIPASTTVAQSTIPTSTTVAQTTVTKEIFNTALPSSLSPSPSSNPVNSTDGNIPIIASCVAAVFLVLVIGIIVLGLTIYCLCWRKNHKEPESISSEHNIEAFKFDNPGADEDTLELEYDYTRNFSSAADKKKQHAVLPCNITVAYSQISQSAANRNDQLEDTSAISLNENLAYGQINQSSRIREQDTSEIKMNENMAYGQINQSTAANENNQDASVIILNENTAYGQINLSTAANRILEQDTDEFRMSGNIAYGHTDHLINHVVSM